MLWLALHFPALALDVHTRGARAPLPLAIASSSGTNAVVLACNGPAHRRGVRQHRRVTGDRAPAVASAIQAGRAAASSSARSRSAIA